MLNMPVYEHLDKINIEVILGETAYKAPETIDLAHDDVIYAKALVLGTMYLPFKDIPRLMVLWHPKYNTLNQLLGSIGTGFDSETNVTVLMYRVLSYV